jgi:hypothetical protein
MAKQDIVIGAVAGVAIAVLAPVAILLAIGKRRPILNALARGGQLLSEKAQETLAECQEIVEDLVAEMRAPSGADIAAATASTAANTGSASQPSPASGATSSESPSA